VRQGKGDLDIVKAGLVDRIEEVCAQLVPGGRIEGGLWVANNPVTRDHGHTPAFKVRVRRGDAGAWRCWRSGDKGDAIDLVAYCLKTDRAGALAWGRDFLGMRAMSREDREKLRSVSRERAESRARQDEKARAKKLIDADRLFSTPGPNARDIAYVGVPDGTAKLGEMTPAERHARAYFAARAMPLDAIPHLNGRTFRFSSATEYWRRIQWETDRQTGRRWKEAPGPFYPAIHSAMRNRLGIVTACHVTFLDPSRPAKAPETPAKLMFGEALGSVIEIACGESGLPFWMADRDGVKPGPLIIGEGIETAGPFAVEIPQARVWAGGSLAGIRGAASLVAALDCIEWVLFARDNNEGNAQAQKQFAAALEDLEATGKRIVVKASHVGDDFNDLAQGDE
jgi:hypothetical protein